MDGLVYLLDQAGRALAERGAQLDAANKEIEALQAALTEGKD